MSDKDWVQELVDIMARLRAPGGCPWDREQTHRSLKEYLAEESAELFDAIDDGDISGMAEELGDVLLQVIFHCQIAAESSQFDLQEVARTCCQKLIRRHPHVFADSVAETPAGVVQQWEKIKLTEKPAAARQSLLSGVPRHLPALHRAYKMQKKASKAGFDWPSIEGVIAKIDEELAEVKEALAAGDDAAVGEEIGDLLFAVVNLGRFQNRVPEELLHDTIRKFERRFNLMEEQLLAQNRTAEASSLEELDQLWEQAKRRECQKP